jgi:hypothetical protein
MSQQINDTEQRNKTVSLKVNLKPADNSDQPISANYTTVNVAPGLVYLDFGFLEPSVLRALTQIANAGKPVPQSLDGKLAVRIAMGYDVLQSLHQQLGQVLTALHAQATPPRNGALESGQKETGS